MSQFVEVQVTKAGSLSYCKGLYVFVRRVSGMWKRSVWRCGLLCIPLKAANLNGRL